jgi:hypothetical protein
MMLESAELITDYLNRYRRFEDRLLQDVRWRLYGTVIELEFDYVWSDNGAIRSEYEQPNLKVLALHNVQEFHLWNGLTEHMSLHPEDLNWGLSEVASVRVVDDPVVLGKYQHVAVPLHHLRCAWEGERRIDIVFATLEVHSARGAH